MPRARLGNKIDTFLMQLFELSSPYTRFKLDGKVLAWHQGRGMLTLVIRRRKQLLKKNL